MESQNGVGFLFGAKKGIISSLTHVKGDMDGEPESLSPFDHVGFPDTDICQIWS